MHPNVAYRKINHNYNDYVADSPYGKRLERPSRFVEVQHTYHVVVCNGQIAPHATSTIDNATWIYVTVHYIAYLSDIHPQMYVINYQ